jgi:hypothetical protein
MRYEKLVVRAYRLNNSTPFILEEGTITNTVYIYFELYVTYITMQSPILILNNWENFHYKTNRLVRKCINYRTRSD